MPTDAEKKDTCRRFLRREYAGKLADLKNLARSVFADASEEVALTTASFEGGSGGGQIKFDKMTLLAAIEDVIAELDPSYVSPLPQFSGSVIRFHP